MLPLKHCRCFSESSEGEKLCLQLNPLLPLLLLLQHLAKLVLGVQQKQAGLKVATVINGVMDAVFIF